MLHRLVLFGAGATSPGGSCCRRSPYSMPRATCPRGSASSARTSPPTWDDKAFRARVQERLRAPRAPGADHPPAARCWPSCATRASTSPIRRPSPARSRWPLTGRSPPISRCHSAASPRRSARSATAGLPAGSRSRGREALRRGPASAVELNAMLADATDHAFRVDHVLGMTRTQEVVELDAQEPRIFRQKKIRRLRWRAAPASTIRRARFARPAEPHAPAPRARRLARGPGGPRCGDARGGSAALPPGALRPDMRTRKTQWTRHAGTGRPFGQKRVEVDLPGWRDARFQQCGAGVAREWCVHRRDGSEERVEVDRLGERRTRPPTRASSARYSAATARCRSARGRRRRRGVIVTPVLDAWAADRVALEEYAPGGGGPCAASRARRGCRARRARRARRPAPATRLHEQQAARGHQDRRIDDRWMPAAFGSVQPLHRPEAAD